jgi:hypothetical protein
MTPSEFATHIAKIAALESTITSQAREIRDLKRALANASVQQATGLKELADNFSNLSMQVQPMIYSAARLEELLIKADRADGMRSLVIALMGGGFIASAGAALLGLFQYFSRGAS